MKSISLVGLVAAVLAMVTLFLRGGLFGIGPVSIALQTLAALLMLWARLTFGLRSFHAVANPTGGGLVTTGPYRFFRHPIYAAVIYFAAIGVACHPSLGNLGLWLVVAGGMGFRMIAEEKLLVQMYPEYETYAARTKRVVPFLF